MKLKRLRASSSMGLILLLAGFATVSLAARRPSWVDSGKHARYTEDNYMTGVGMAPRTGSHKEVEDRVAADGAAYREIAKQIKVQVKSEQTHIVTEVIGGGRASDASATEQTVQIDEVSSNIVLQGLSIKERWYDGDAKVYYSLAVLDRSIAAGALQHELTELETSAQAHYARARQGETDRRLYPALDAYADCLEAGLLAAERRRIVAVVTGSAGAGAAFEELESETAPGEASDASESVLPVPAEIAGRIASILSALTIEVDSGMDQGVRPGERLEEPLTVKLSYSADDIWTSYEGFTIDFKIDDGEGELKEKAVTSRDGRASTEVYKLTPVGKDLCLISACLDLSFIADGNNPGYPLLENNLIAAGEKVVFSLRLAGQTLSDMIAGLVHKLKTGLKLPEGKRISVVVGNFTYQDTRLSGSFITYFLDKLETAFSSDERFQLINKTRLNFAMRTQSSGFRGIEPPSTARGMAKLVGSKAVLTGNYWDRDDRVEINAQLIETEEGVILAAATTDVGKSLIPPGLSLTPGNLPEAEPALEVLTKTQESGKLPGSESGAETLKIDLWVDHGDGGIYQDGDLLHIYFRASDDCHLLLLYRDAGGNNYQIFPNQYDEYNLITAGKTYTIPDENDNFDFEVGQPFGVELITAFASTQPFNLQGVNPGGAGIIPLEGQTREIWENLRGIKVTKRDAKYAEASCIITTVPRP